MSGAVPFTSRRTGTAYGTVSIFPNSLRHLSATECGLRDLPWPDSLLCLVDRLMRLLLIALLVSLGALLIAAAGMARHIWLQRAKLRREPLASFEPPEDSETNLGHSGTTMLGLNAGRSSQSRFY